jgi:hypothetical protein
LLRDQVRRYGADRLTSFPPRNSRSIETPRHTRADHRDLNRRRPRPRSGSQDMNNH